MKFKDAIRQANPDLEVIPSGFKRYGHLMVLRSSEQLTKELGDTIISTYSWCTSVYQHRTTTGQSRIPQLVHLAGIDDPEVLHKENGVRYEIDISQITFSGGNRLLRERCARLTKDGEFLLDMFAAVGNLSLQPLVHNEIDGLLVERNPYTFSYLKKNLELNSISPHLAINTDCRSITLEDKADRIFMGYHEVDETHLSVAIKALNSSGSIHLHPIVPVDDWDQQLRDYEQLINQCGASITDQSIYSVKDFSPGLEHIEIIYQISK